MRKNWGLSSGHARPFGDRRWLLPFLASLLVTATLLLAAACGLFSPPYPSGAGDAALFDVVSLADWDDDGGGSSSGGGAPSVEAGIKNRLLEDNAASDDDDENPDDAAVNSDDSDAEPPRIAYLLEGTKGDGLRMRRTLQAIYHPRNQYILHLDLEAPPRERIDLAMYVKGDPMFSQVGNVRVIAKGNLVTYKGPTMVACTLHAVAILLKEGLQWDWFINLSASDYPLMTQDDILHVFSSLPRNLNFIEHFRLSGWKVNIRAKPIVLDPGLYLSKKFDLTMTTERRELPTSFKLYTGSAWIMLTKSFLEYCIWGWDNLPRNLLMYYVNFISSPEGYFQTVICNSDDFRGTAVGHDLHYIAWDYPPKQHPLILSMKDFNKMVKSGAPFARKFPKDDKVLDKIDRELLHRSEGQFTPGAWCDGSSEGGADPCLSRGEDSVFEPGPGAERLRGLMKKVLSWDYRNGSCSSLAYDQTKRDWRRWSGRPPLITCLDCKCRQVVELKSKQPWSCDEVFYTCPSHRQDGTDCPFWHWEAGYIKYLEQHPEAVKEAVKEVVSDEHFGTGLMEEAQAGRDVSQLLDKLRTLVALGYEITWLLKCLAVMGIFSVVVLGMLLAVAMTKNI